MRKRNCLLLISICAVAFLVYALFSIKKVGSDDFTNAKQSVVINEIRFDSIGGVINFTVKTAGKKQNYEPQFFLDNMSAIVDLDSEDEGTKSYNMYFVDDKDSKNAVLFLDGVKQNADIVLNVTDELSYYKNDKYEFGISAVSGYIKGNLPDEEIEITINYKDGSTYPVYSTTTSYSNELPVITFPNHKNLGASFFWLNDIRLEQIESVKVNGQTLMLSSN